MQSAVLVAPRTIEIQERPVPEPGPGAVRLKIAAVGVCGSDVHYYVNGRIGSAVVQYPTLMGHEPAGVVDAVGPDVAPVAGVELTPGRRVAIEPAAPCGRCEHCHGGRANICPDVRFLGTPPIDGIYEEYHLMPARCCIPIPAGLSLTEAALLEPLGVGLHAMELAKPRPGDTVAILGAGPIGLVTLMAAKLAGCAEVYMTDPVPERRAFAERLGADAVADPGAVDATAWIREQTHGRGVDITVDAAGVQETITQCHRAARIGGQALIIGIPDEDALTYPTHEARRRELVVRHVRRSNGEVERCLGLIASGRLDLKPLATHHFALDQVTDAFELVHRHADGVIRAIIHPHPDLTDA